MKLREIRKMAKAKGIKAVNLEKPELVRARRHGHDLQLRLDKAMPGGSSAGALIRRHPAGETIEFHNLV
jgi:hypothetical protein